ncbi:MAG: DUF418 domain-containing protein, partial [Caulobacterales bacterium]|nr:DUF418 domain-containing protein [Caulobacterales bacterium]
LLFTHGDILMLYALAGLIAAEARRWRPVTLCLAAGALIAVSAGWIAVGLQLADAKGGVDPEALARWRPADAEIARLEAMYRGPWLARIAQTVDFVVEAQMSQALVYLPRTLGVMLLGMALWKTGFLRARRPVWTYAVVALLAPLGLWASDRAAAGRLASDFALEEAAQWRLTLYAASLPQALGYAALVMLAVKTPLLRPARAPFAAAGRMALTNYLGCSLAAALIFYGPPGAGRMGELGHAAQAPIVALFWAVMLAGSTVWLAAFRHGPAEWAWRSLTYQERQPMRRAPRAEAGS